MAEICKNQPVMDSIKCCISGKNHVNIFHVMIQQSGKILCDYIVDYNTSTNKNLLWLKTGLNYKLGVYVH